eukprot:scaffold1273_cov401-Prasinococcus_capsulatus_cf.AAC.2
MCLHHDDVGWVAVYWPAGGLDHRVRGILACTISQYVQAQPLGRGRGGRPLRAPDGGLATSTAARGAAACVHVCPCVSDCA